jgi:SAM-dependent methyltransferase
MTDRATNESLEQEARERLYPSITNPNWLVLRARRKIFAAWLSQLNGISFRILDVGGRLQPYRPLFDGRVGGYYSLDLQPAPTVSCAGRAENLPFGDNLFDVVLCTQVLEYAPNPQRVVDEIRRVLRPGCHLFLSAPAVFLRDSDPEYWRFLPSALRLLLRDFSSTEIVAEGSSISGLFRTVNVTALSLSPKPSRVFLKYTMTPLLNIAASFLEAVLRSSNDQFTANFSVLARK